MTDDRPFTERDWHSLLEVEKSELEKLSRASRESRQPVVLDQQQQGRLSRMDAIQQQHMDIARDQRRQQRLAMISAALRRLEQGEFGYCLACGEDIPTPRLKADPAVTQCLDCRGR